MLVSQQSQPSWVISSERIGQAAFGWCGSQASRLTRKGNALVLIDGHLYNRPELAEHESDAEWLADLYHRYGFEDALRQINGDFAAVLYDIETDTLWLGRDRFGVKPLYYVNGGDGFAFASQPRALLQLPWVRREPARAYVARYAATHYRYLDNQPDDSPYEDIRQLPAAHSLRLHKGQLTKSRYWDLSDLPEFTESEETLATDLRDLLIDAVRLRLKSSRRPGFTISGGMDSSSVLASAVRVTGEKQVAFSTTYDDKTYDETVEIKSMLDSTVSRWVPVAIGTPDVLGLVQRMVEIHDEPVATATWLSHFLLCDQVRQEGVEALFGGMGGDELNAGEYEHFFYFFADLKVLGLERELRNEAEQWALYHDHPIYRKGLQQMHDGLSRLVDLSMPGRCRPDEYRLRRYYSAMNPEYFDLGGFEPVMDHPFSSYLKNRTYQDLFRETLPCCLRAQDRQCTAFGLDHCEPFLDYRLAEFMFRVPGRLKIRNGVTKWLLRLSTRGLLPEETRTRIKKTGWNAPAHLWFSGKGREQVLDLVRSRAFRERGIFVAREVERIIEEHERTVVNGLAAENHMMFLWQLVNLELWLRSVGELSTRVDLAQVKDEAHEARLS